MRIAVIGAGNMSEAILAGVIEQGYGLRSRSSSVIR